MLCQDHRATTSSYPSVLVAHHLVSEILQLVLVYVGFADSVEDPQREQVHLLRDLVLRLLCEVVRDLLVHLLILLELLAVPVLEELLEVEEVARARDQDQLGCLL